MTLQVFRKVWLNNASEGFELTKAFSYKVIYKVWLTGVYCELFVRNLIKRALYMYNLI